MPGSRPQLALALVEAKEMPTGETPHSKESTGQSEARCAPQDDTGTGLIE